MASLSYHIHCLHVIIFNAQPLFLFKPFFHICKLSFILFGVVILYIEKYEVLGEKDWYFFTPRDRKYRNGSRPDRKAGDGYWKATGADKLVKWKGVTVGYRKALVFYEGRPPKGNKTNWIMHEYRVDEPPRKRSGGNSMRVKFYFSFTIPHGLVSFNHSY